MIHPVMRDNLLRLLRRKWVSPIDALRECGCLSLSQRVTGTFRPEGYVVLDRWLKLPNGKRCKQYRVVGKKEAV